MDYVTWSLGIENFDSQKLLDTEVSDISVSVRYYITRLAHH